MDAPFESKFTCNLIITWNESDYKYKYKFYFLQSNRFEGAQNPNLRMLRVVTIGQPRKYNQAPRCVAGWGYEPASRCINDSGAQNPNLRMLRVFSVRMPTQM